MEDDGGPIERKPVAAEMQRGPISDRSALASRGPIEDPILDAVVGVVAEHGVAGASVELVLARAGVSRRAFYGCFEDLDECLVAVLNGALERAAPLVVGAFAGEGSSWWEGMRAALAEMLVFFESEPELARVCMVEAQAAGPVVREHRERIFEAFRALVVERVEGEVSHASPLAAEGLLASVVGIVNARLLARESRPLVELLGPLMGIVVGSFMDEAGVEREIERGDELARELLAGRGEEGQAESGRPGRSPGVAQRPGEYPSVAPQSPVAARDPEAGAALGGDARAGVVERLRARREELVGALFARIRVGALAGSGDDDAEYVAGLRAAVVGAVEYVLEGIERGEGWVGPIPVVVVEQARRAARVGVPLETVLRRYLVGHTLFERFVMDEAAGSEEKRIPPTQGEAVRGALRAQAAMLDRLLESIAGEYGVELQRMGRSPEQRRSERVRRLLEDGVPEDGAVAGAGLEYELGDRWHLGVIATGADAAQAVRGLAVSADRRLLSVSHGERSVWAWLGGRQRFAAGEVERVIVGVVAGTGGAPLPKGVVLALGEPAWGVDGWRLTHQQAQAALVVALRRNGIPRNEIPPARGVTRYADVALLASALKDPALAQALLDIYIAPLVDTQNRGLVLLQTLRAYLAAECNVSSAAIKLGVARSTVKDRMRTIEERLGRTLQRCPPELEVALELDQLIPATHPAGIPIAGESVT
jgi:AcrR family transcriptional regulator